jgi:hypothetical protein
LLTACGVKNQENSLFKHRTKFEQAINLNTAKAARRRAAKLLALADEVVQ